MGDLDGAPRRAAPRLVTVVAPVHDEEELVDVFVERVRAAMDGLPWELILVDDGSVDGSVARIRAHADAEPNVRGVVLSRNFGQPVATTAGLQHAAGEVVVMIDSDLQDPPEVIPRLVAAWQAGADVVFAVRTSREGETRLKLLTARLFYRGFSRLASVKLQENAGDFRLLGRPALDAFLAMPERGRFVRGMTSWVGFEQATVTYERQARPAGTSKYPFLRLTRMAFDAVASFSHIPLQLATILGFLVSGGAFVMAAVLFSLRLFGDYLAGFSTTNIIVLLLGGIQLITLGVIGEYLAKIYDEVKQRPLYVVRERLNLESYGETPLPPSPSSSTDAMRERVST